MPPANVVRPPADIRLVCDEHDVEYDTWTYAWDHQLNVHGGSMTVPWFLVAGE